MQPMAMSLLFWSVSITRVVRKVATHCVLMIMTLRCSQSHGYSNMSIISRGSDCRSATKNVEFARVVCHLFGQDTFYFFGLSASGSICWCKYEACALFKFNCQHKYTFYIFAICQLVYLLLIQCAISMI